MPTVVILTDTYHAGLNVKCLPPPEQETISVVLGELKCTLVTGAPKAFLEHVVGQTQRLREQWGAARGSSAQPLGSESWCLPVLKERGQQWGVRTEDTVLDSNPKSPVCLMDTPGHCPPGLPEALIPPQFVIGLWRVPDGEGVNTACEEAGH